MALSGAFNRNIGSHWRMRVEWSATQNIAANTSTITMELYWEGLTQYSQVFSSSTNNGSQTIDGNSASFTASPAINANQKKLLNRRTRTINHNSDGSKSLTLSASFALNVTLAGTYYGNQTFSSSITLDTIPRASSISSAPNLTAGANMTMSISRASTSFRHDVWFDLQNSSGSWINIKSWTGINTSVSTSFTTADIINIFNQLNGRTSTPSRIRIQTKSGNTNIGGVVSRTGTVSAPNNSYVSSSRNFNIGNSVPITISRANSSFTHTVRIKFGNSTIATLSGVGQSTTWTPSTAQINSMHNATPNANKATVTFEVDTFYSTAQVRVMRSNTGTASVVDANPVFPNSRIAYYDSNTATVSITSSNQYVIQNKSVVVANITSAATPQKGSSISSYRLALNGNTWTRTGIGTHSLGILTANSNVTLTVDAIDSRGNSTRASITVQVLPYSTPSLTTISSRLYGFEDETTLRIRGTISPLIVASQSKNLVQSAMYRIKLTTTSTWGSWTSFSGLTLSGGEYSVDPTILNLPKENSYNLEFRVGDVFQTVTIARVIDVGIPFIFMDSVKKALGVNTFPETGYMIDIAGRAQFTDLIHVKDLSGGKSTLSRNTSTGREILEIRANTSLTTGSAINMYGNNDSTAPGKIYFYTNNSARMSVSREGYVGIGTVNPVINLHVNGGGELLRLDNTTANGTVFLTFHAGNTRRGWVGFGSTSSTIMTIANSAGHINLSTDSNSYVGVNTTSPTETFDVNGSARFRSGAKTGSLLNPHSNILYIGASQEVRAVSAGNINTYQNIRALGFPTGSSILYKQNVKEFTKDALGMIMDIKPQIYHLNNNIDNGIYDKPKVGFISEMVHPLMRDEDGVDPYSITSITWRGIQQHNEKIVALEQRVKDLELLLEQMV
ncbi:DUF859 family phage minor structural protein [Sutcliffiella rhizosphaerae]|uniref:Peptidase S74 domain-containing protein n=1 Tax=Sutcliffiella rhizosphaerae TaxID=2880967 RepID=A0ABM8YM54_9BACI|nr:DUF859 family phage minor structural protein [Sutcliffiella rhizosphaerae]CAG9621087.1 hypothetical protein BACCIP111883_01859 [Sutcliffiella rhizosphaerae]